MTDGSPQVPRASVTEPRVGEAPSRRMMEELDTHAQIEGFLPAAMVRLIAITDEATATLGIEAIKQAKVRHGTAVDESDVIAADAKLNQTEHTYRVKAWFFGIGGILIGAGLSAVPSVALTNPMAHRAIWWGAIAVLLIAGAILALIGFPRKKPR